MAQPDDQDSGTDMLLSRGRKVPGKGNTDKVRAKLTPGEFVSTKAATAAHEPTLERWNREANKATVKRNSMKRKG